MFLNDQEFKRPQLVKRDAIHISTIKSNTCSTTRKKYIPDYTVIEKYASYPYIKYHQHVTDGFIREISDTLSIPFVINNICHKYCHNPQDGIFQLAYFVSCMKKDNNVTNDSVLLNIGFSGHQLMTHFASSISSLSTITKQELAEYCNQLLIHRYIKPVTFRSSQNILSDAIFCNSTQYNANPKKMKVSSYAKFTRFYDRLAWNVGSLVEIRSISKGWQKGQIVGINKVTKVTVIFQSDLGEILRKTVNRFDVANIRSTEEFIEVRKGWNKGTVIEIYSASERKWFKGHITDIFIPNEDKSYIEHMNVMYDDTDKTCTESVSRWSSFARNLHKGRVNNGVQIGSQADVWSNSKKQWISGYIKTFVPIVNCVIVKYGNREKIVKINSDALKLQQQV